ncbi:MAG TPA: trigger factor [Alphaproteobacteria bacterium]|nr:trigger factor [Alphaproteobacteria bacterium]
MLVEKISEKKLEREYNVTVPAEKINNAVNNKLAAISKNIKMPGFRAGKVPLNLVKQKYNGQALSEVLEDTINEATSAAIKDNNLKVASQPKIQVVEFAEGKDLKYKLSVEVLPEVPEIKFEKIKLNKFKPEIQEADLKELFDIITKNYKNFEEIKEARKTKSGDAVLIDFKGFVDNVAFPGGEATGYQLELGSNSFIPGFEDQLIGKNAGDEVKVNVKFPEEYHSKDLAGKDALFEVKIHKIKAAADTVLNDEFAKKVGYESIDEFRKQLTSELETDGNNIARVILKRDLFDQLADAYKIDLPSQMVENELKSVVEQIKQAKENVDEKGNELTEEDLRKKFLKLAERRVLLGIVVTEIAVKNNIQVTREDINKALADEAARYPGQQQQVIDFYRKNPQALERLKGPVIEEKVVDFIVSKSKISEDAKSLGDLKKLVLENNNNF